MYNTSLPFMCLSLFMGKRGRLDSRMPEIKIIALSILPSLHTQNNRYACILVLLELI